MPHPIVQKNLVGSHSNDERLEVHHFIPEDTAELLKSHRAKQTLDALHITEIDTGYQARVKLANSKSSLRRGVLEPWSLVYKVLPFSATAFLEGFTVEA